MVWTHYAQIKPLLRRVLWYSNCDKKIQYSIESIDVKFGISDKEVLEDTYDAASIWNSYIGRQIFVYDPNGKLKIKLVYDERQRLYTKLIQQEANLEKEKTKIENSIAIYQLKIKELNAEIARLNNDVDYWNKRGGAPENEYEDLVSRINEVRTEINKNNAERNLLINNVNAINDAVSQLNDTISEFNNLLQTKPEEGLYISEPEEIQIYFYDSKPQFIHTLTHEFGHALGLEHVEEDISIMNSVTNNSLTFSNEDKTAIDEYCKEINRVEYIMGIIKNRLIPVLIDWLQNASANFQIKTYN